MVKIPMEIPLNSFHVNCSELNQQTPLKDHPEEAYDALIDLRLKLRKSPRWSDL